ncbi:MAG: ABC transporter ATP-binding protein [Alphaproteobacteria bacterium]|nr:ABC transporter ATP-binding protein [Alphaproteobacteria bacterium]
MIDPALSFKNVQLYRKQSLVFEDFSHTFDPGKCYALMGPNGSGKSSLLHLALGLVTPQKGFCTLLGGAPAQARSRVSYLPEKLFFFPSLTAQDLLRTLTTSPDHRARADDFLKMTAFRSELYGKPLKDLSKGSYQKILLSVSLTAEKEVYFLDEPTTGLDPASVDKVLIVIRDLCTQGRTLLFTTHSAYETKEAHTLLTFQNHSLFPLENKKAIDYYNNTWGAL